MEGKEGGQFHNVPGDREQVAKMLGATEVPVFSKQESEHLKVFQSNVSAANHAEQMLANGHSVPVVEIGLGGQTTKSSLNERHVSRMNHAAFDLYVAHLRPSDALRDAAQTIVTAEKKIATDRQKELPEVKQLNTLWEAPTYKDVGKDVDDEERAVR